MIKLFNGDCLIESDKIEDGSVDLILMDPPYGTIKGQDKSPAARNSGLREVEWDVIIEPEKIFNIANRILRKNGKLVIFSQEPYTSKLITETIPNIPFSYRMVWNKLNYGSPLKAKKAPLGHFEDILVFSKMHDNELLHPLREYTKKLLDYIGLNKKGIVEKIGQKVDHFFRHNSPQFSLCTEKTYKELIEVFNIDKMEGFKNYEELKEIDNKYSSTFNLWEGKKYKNNVLEYKKDYTGHHPTQKPVLLLEDLIKTYSNEGNLVVDLTMGSGSTGVACVNTKRSFIGIEMDEGYFKIAEQRIKDK